MNISKNNDNNGNKNQQRSKNLSALISAKKLTEKDCRDNVQTLVSVRNKYDHVLLHDTARFFTDKILTLTGSDNCQKEVYRMARYLQMNGENPRAAFFITSRGFHLRDLSCRYLAAKCYYDCQQYTEALEILSLPVDEKAMTFDEKSGTLTEWKSSIEFLKGQSYQGLGDRTMAKRFYLDALRLNVACYEAFAAFTRFSMYTKEEEKELLSILAFDPAKDPTTDPIQMLKFFMLSELNRAGNSLDECGQSALVAFESNLPTSSKLLPSGNNITNNLNETICTMVSNSLDGMLIQADRLYKDCEFKSCYSILSNIATKDPFNERCLLLTISCLLELNKSTALQQLSHKLVDVYPESALTWYAVGCYYYIQRNCDQARKYLSKATSMDPAFHPAMLMFGHSFELESLHDQALAVYLDLSKVMSNSYLPFLYVGVEYGHLNNFTMAERYLHQALKLSKQNIFILHEMAMVAYNQKDYEKAMFHFTSVYNILLKRFNSDGDHDFPLPQRWEPLLNNLGHCCRMLGQLDQAVKYHSRALLLVPQNYSTLDSLGVVYTLQGKWQAALDSFAAAQGLKRDDAFAMTMQNRLHEIIRGNL